MRSQFFQKFPLPLKNTYSLKITAKFYPVLKSRISNEHRKLLPNVSGIYFYLFGIICAKVINCRAVSGCRRYAKRSEMMRVFSPTQFFSEFACIFEWFHAPKKVFQKCIILGHG